MLVSILGVNVDEVLLCVSFFCCFAWPPMTNGTRYFYSNVSHLNIIFHELMQRLPIYFWTNLSITSNTNIGLRLLERSVAISAATSFEIRGSDTHSGRSTEIAVLFVAWNILRTARFSSVRFVHQSTKSDALYVHRDVVVVHRDVTRDMLDYYS